MGNLNINYSCHARHPAVIELGRGGIPHYLLMKQKPLTATKILILSTLAIIVGQASAAPVRWDFGGSLDSANGSGSTKPGVVVGATFTGFIASDTTDFGLVTSYHKFDGNIAIYRSPMSILSYTVSFGGDTHSYTLRDLDVALTARDVGDSYRLEFDGPFFLLAKDVYGSRLSDLSFQTFLAGMATGLNDGSGLLVIGDSSWANGVQGHLTSLVQVPEPSRVGLLGIAGVAGVSRSRSRHRNLSGTAT